MLFRSVEDVDPYSPRIVDTELDELTAQLPAISIEGPKGVGKTVTAARRASTVHDLDEPASLNFASGDPARLLLSSPPVLIDEWQHIPSVWNLVRRAVDAGAGAGTFLLTGSASPPSVGLHSGAGRIVTVRMRPLTLPERGFATPTVSLGQLLTGQRPTLTGASAAGLEDYVNEILRSGLPGIRLPGGP